jgi:hypothetical protein
MTLTALIAALGLAGLLFLIAAAHRFRRRFVGGAVFSGLTSLVLFLLAACVLLVAIDLRGYQRLTSEQPAGELMLSRVGVHQFNGVLTYPTGAAEVFSLRGDEWQVDARILKWRALATLFGFDAVYRLDRISGRYSNIADERGQPRTVYPLSPPEPIDLWEFIQSHHSWVPWIDAMYGTATFLPMADKALFQIDVSPSGLLARPLNQAARDAVSGWH